MTIIKFLTLIRLTFFLLTIKTLVTFLRMHLLIQTISGYSYSNTFDLLLGRRVLMGVKFDPTLGW